MKYIELEKGSKINKLTILEEFKLIKSGRSRRYVKCECECGNICVIEKSKLLSNSTKSCGCLQKESRKSLGSRFKKDFGEAQFNELYNSYKKSAKLRGYNFELTKEQFKDIVVKPCIYCGGELTQVKRKDYANGSFRYTGIDRYDNSRGYTLENSVPCCKKCNRMKTDMNINEFEEQLEKIISNKDMWKRIF